MRIAICILVLGWLGLPGVAEAQTSRGKWLRRVTLAASCAASAWDIQTTAAAINRGGRESNGLFADPLGRPRWGRVISFKVGLCGGMIASQELNLWGRPTPLKDNLWIGINTGLTTRFTVASVRNRALAP